MNLYVPDYYPAFRCIAERCRHTCCAGWEIDIDGESLARYDRLPGDFGDRVRRCIDREGTPHIILTEDERYLFDLRERWLASMTEEGPRARLLETLSLRHLSNALYDGRLEARIDFIRRAFAEIAGDWTDGDLATLIERARAFSDQVEYDHEVLEAWIGRADPV